jgi:phosphoribosylaminoimidazole carboxylase (NCAIR synthetase)
VNERFPTVGIIGAGHLTRMTFAPAEALGINLLIFAQNSDDSAAQIAPHVLGHFRDLTTLQSFAAKCDVITFEDESIPSSVIKGLEAAGVRVCPSSASIQYSQDQILTKKPDYFDLEISVMVARSAHAQATSWAPTQMIKSDGICTSTISPAPDISQAVAEKAQHLALSIANDISLVGVMAVEMFVNGEDLFVNELKLGPHDSGNWTIEGSRTSQFEQHLRAILDLPLGDPTMTASFAVTGIIFGGDKTDMYRPYLHLMARNPQLKFHQYKNEVLKGRKIGHITVTGEKLPELNEIVEHARDYMCGEIDE